MSRWLLSVLFLTLLAFSDAARSRERALRRRRGGRVARGEAAPPGRFPYMCSLRESNAGEHHCGCVLVAPNWVVTAAHCVDTSFSTQASFSPGVWIGLHFRSEADDQVEKLTALRTIVHCDWDGDLTAGNDIAMIELSAESEYQPIGLAAKGDEPGIGQLLLALGWGRLEHQGPLAEELQMATDLAYRTDDACAQMRGEALPDGTVCAFNALQDTCPGDSGGPLLIANHDRTGKLSRGDPSLDRLIGITSFGRERCKRRKRSKREIPGVYTQISDFRDWMDEVMETGDQAEICGDEEGSRSKSRRRRETPSISFPPFEEMPESLIAPLPPTVESPTGPSRAARDVEGSGRYPYMCSLSASRKQSDFFCNCVLIDANWVLTAANCFDPVPVVTPPNSRDPWIFIGTPMEDGQPEVFRAEQIVIKCGYSELHENGNDLALVELSEASSLRPIDLPPASTPTLTIEDDEVQAAAVGFVAASGESNPVFNATTAILMGDELCATAWNSEIPDSAVCGGNPTGQVCQMYSGALLMDPNIGSDGTFETASPRGDVLRGIKSYYQQSDCGDSLSEVFTDVSNFRDWIDDVIEQGRQRRSHCGNPSFVRASEFSGFNVGVAPMFEAAPPSPEPFSPSPSTPYPLAPGAQFAAAASPPDPPTTLDYPLAPPPPSFVVGNAGWMAVRAPLLLRHAVFVTFRGSVRYNGYGDYRFGRV